MKYLRPSNAALVVVNAALILGVFHWVGCASSPYVAPQEPDKPGYLYSETWYGRSVSPGNSAYPTEIDIDGTVGHPLTVGSMRARAVGGWTANISVVTGELPPGLSFDQRDYITGIPTERGHWIVHLKASNLRTGVNNEYSFEDVHVILRFHITGSGEVHE
jgi:hypothetical protein